MSSQSDNSAEPESAGVRAPNGATNLIDTDYQIGQDNYRAKHFGITVDLHGVVFIFSAIVVLAFVFLSLALPEQSTTIFEASKNWINTHMTWFFLLSANIFVVLCLGLIISPLGRIRIGGVEAKPDFSRLSWFSMLFAAGMGIGLVFYGVSEPLSHYNSAFGGTSVGTDGLRTDWAPLGGAAGDPEAARKLGMAATIFHWGLHPWAIYAIVALSLAIFSFNKGLPLTVRSIFYPILGERIWGWPGHLIDILAVFATLFGLATSLGLGAQQAASGLDHLFGVGDGNVVLVLLIAAITAIAIVSILAGVDKGVKRLSEINMVLAFVLLMFVVFVGPTLLIFSNFFSNLSSYLTELPALSNPFGREDANFSQGWTTFYWAWWISWSPFVGMFIARVSRGRTVRDFLISVMLIPSLVSVFWMTAFGTNAITQLQSGFDGVVSADLPLKLFVMLEQLPLTEITSFIGIILVIVFFITSSDSGSLVIDTITAGGKIDAPKPQRVFWGVIEGAIAVALLLGGGLAALQAASISAGLPFTIVLLVGCYAIVRGLMTEPR
ncbi:MULTISPECIES: BCCT family transporter [unclassified Methylophaga]|uniref:BCCT transporter n=3 Tax=Gammaproteobacteria TaxID=1236 RepID=A0A2T4CXZ3_9GAMM|nr:MULTISPECIES: BCCT family transporter [unclassified Methylophaga]MAL49611.1 BCCT transporter [Methylophaga sp.]MBP26108.1 BCCT transporter [Methylophaga sp.]MDX1749725.1 BCCT family transporter [Methylophaga sp.]PTB86429.1 BCCT transporter [Pseudidiomarina aestuarii]